MSVVIRAAITLLLLAFAALLSTAAIAQAQQAPNHHITHRKVSPRGRCP
jgi:hypothetical protein